MEQICEACTAARLEMPASLLLTRSNRPFSQETATRRFFCELGVVCRTERSIVRKTVSAPLHSVTFFLRSALGAELEFQTQDADRTTTDEVLTISKIRPRPQLFSPSITGPPSIPLEEIIALAFPFSGKTRQTDPLVLFPPALTFCGENTRLLLLLFSQYISHVRCLYPVLLPSAFDPLLPLPQKAKTFTTLPFPPSLQIEARGEVALLLPTCPFPKVPLPRSKLGFLKGTVRYYAF